MQMEFVRRMPLPQELLRDYPIGEEMKRRKAARDGQIADILTGADDRLLLIIGPCSADREDAVLDYMHRLSEVEQQVRDRLMIVPRVYTNKPRTKGVGSYLSDLLSYVAVGARSVENQEHRLVASGLGVAAGMKNPSAGDITVMMNSIAAAQSPQEFIYRSWEVRTSGNPLAHAILRGFVDNFGRSHPNYHYENLWELLELYKKSGLQNPAVIVDANHNNSGKRYLEQIRICKDVMHSRALSADIHGLVKGLMVESYLEDGCQKPGEGMYGRSITDPCLGWEKTKELIYKLAE